MGRKLLLSVTALVVLLAYAVYKEPIPGGATQPYRIRWHLFLMRVAIDYAPQLSAAVGYSSLLEARRFTMGQSQGWDAAGVQVTNATFDDVTVRIFRHPDDVKAPPDGRPGVLYVHGGGWTILTLDSYHHVTSRLARDLQAVVVSVDYRMAPEHRFTDCLDDVVKSYKYFVKNARKYNVDAKRIIIMGDSAGGTLTAGASLRLRDESFQPQPKLQVPIYPVTQSLDLISLPSYQQNAAGPFLTHEMMCWFFSLTLLGNADEIDTFRRNAHVPQKVRAQYAEKGYLSAELVPSELRYPPYELRRADSMTRPSDSEDADKSVWRRIRSTVLSPYFSPLLAEDLSGLPPALLYVAKHDVLRDEGLLYARRLRDAGNDVEHVLDPRGWHPNLLVWLADPDAEAAMADFIDRIRKRL